VFPILDEFVLVWERRRFVHLQSSQRKKKRKERKRIRAAVAAAM
jgi:hypothetical protein